jgi:hypothetical protein
VPRTATVRARRDSTLLALDRDDFLTAVNGYAPSLSSAEAVVGLPAGPRLGRRDIRPERTEPRGATACAAARCLGCR